MNYIQDNLNIKVNLSFSYIIYYVFSIFFFCFSYINLFSDLRWFYSFNLRETDERKANYFGSFAILLEM